MRRLRILLALCLSALLLACRPPAPLATAPALQVVPLLRGQVLLPAGYQAQANPGQVRANATVTLIDPANFQAKGTGITQADGSFTLQALASFTPTLGALYLLESNKALGGAGSAAFRLRTLVQYTSAGWTSVSGASVQLSTATTAVALLWDHHGLAAADVVGKVSYDALTHTHRFLDLTSTLTQVTLQEVADRVTEALLVGLDPLQAVRPGPDGHYGLSLASRSRNGLINPGFEVGANTAPGWKLNNPAVATFSVETGIVHTASRSIRLTVNGTGDTWFGQGYTGSTDTFGVPLASGTAYTFSVYARGAAGGEKLRLCVNYEQPFGEAGSPTITLTTSYQRYTWSFVSAHTTDRAVVFFRYGSQVGQTALPATLYLDDAQFEAGGAATSYSPPIRLTLEGFANALETANLTPAPGKVGRAVVAEQGINLLASSSFEVDSDADGLPDGVALSGSGGTYTRDSDALFGTRSLKIAKSSATGDYAYFSHGYNYRAGHTYTLSVWVKGENVSGAPSESDFGIYVDPTRVGGGLSYPDIIKAAAPTGTFGWTRVCLTHTFVNDCTSAKVIPMFRFKTGTVWFDGFQIEENAYASPYAGDGPDRLIFDANRYVNPQEGTIAFWYQPTFGWDDPSGTGVLMGLSNPGQDAVLQLSKFMGGDGRYGLRFGLRHESLDDHEWRYAEYVPTTVAWRAGDWHHVAVSWGPAGMALYLDGTAVATHLENGGIWTTSSEVHPAPYLGILSFSGGGRNFNSQINGALDGLKIWDGQLGVQGVRREYLGLAL